MQNYRYEYVITGGPGILIEHGFIDDEDYIEGAMWAAFMEGNCFMCERVGQ